MWKTLSFLGIYLSTTKWIGNTPILTLRVLLFSSGFSLLTPCSQRLTMPPSLPGSYLGGELRSSSSSSPSQGSQEALLSSAEKKLNFLSGFHIQPGGIMAIKLIVKMWEVQVSPNWDCSYVPDHPGLPFAFTCFEDWPSSITVPKGWEPSTIFLLSVHLILSLLFSQPHCLCVLFRSLPCFLLPVSLDASSVYDVFLFPLFLSLFLLSSWHCSLLTFLISLISISLPFRKGILEIIYYNLIRKWDREQSQPRQYHQT